MIRVVDLESCGLEPPAGICEIGWCDLAFAGGRYQVGLPASLFIDPSQPIPPETSAVHHIIDADVSGAAPFGTAAREVCKLTVDRPVLAAHNSAFERKWLTPEFTGAAEWICTYRCALRVFPDAPAHNNGTLRYWLNPPGLDRRLADPAHRAGPDAYVTAFLLREMLARASLDELITWSAEPALLVRCRFGKHRGTPWRDVPTDYLRWCAGQQMDEDVAFTVRSELARRAA